MLSRVASSVFWLARYMERTNGMLRLLRTNYIAGQDELREFNWSQILRTYSNTESVGNGLPETDSVAALDHILFGRDNQGSVLNNITRARENARAVQDYITKEVWQCLNDYFHLIRNPGLQQQVRFGDPVSALDSLIHQGLLYHGTVDITLARGEGFNYLNIGKFLERGMLTIDMLGIKLAELNYSIKQPLEVPRLRYLLYSLSGYELYLKTYRGNFQADLVLQHIIYNNNFPHSVSYCLKQLCRYFERLEPESLPENYKAMDFLIGRTMNAVKYSDLKAAEGENLKTFLQHTRNELAGIATGFNQFYFGNS